MYDRGLVWRWLSVGLLAAAVGCKTNGGGSDAGQGGSGVVGQSGGGPGGAATAGGAAGASAASGGAAAGTGGGAGRGGAVGSGGSGCEGGFGGAIVSGGPVTLAGVMNARHTGGLPTCSGQWVRPEVLIRSGHLANLDAAGCTDLQTLAVNTVLDLRSASEAADTPDADCVVSATRHTIVDLPRVLPPSSSSYLQTLDATEPKLPTLFAELGADGALPALMHCVIGRDRANLVMIVVLLALGVPESYVVADFLDNQDATVDAAWLDGVLERIAQAGGIDAYLSAHGVQSEDLARLRAAALE